MASKFFDKYKIDFKKPTKMDVRFFIKNNLIIILGTFILALGVELFIVPSNLVTGGVSGLAIVIKNLGASIDVNNLITIITWSLFGIGFIFLGTQFSLKTLTSTIVYTLSLYLISHLANVFPWLYLKNSPSISSYPAIATLLSAVFGGVFVGLGCALTYIVGGSTGGVDIITFVVCKFLKFIKSSYMIFIVDATIVILGFIFTKDLALCLEGVLSAFVTALVIDKVLVGGSQNFIAHIVTDKYEEINKEIIEKLDRTSSIIDIVGGYSKEDKKMLLVSYSIREYAIVRSMVARIDPKAFLMISKCNEIKGEGFKPMDE